MERGLDFLDISFCCRRISLKSYSEAGFERARALKGTGGAIVWSYSLMRLKLASGGVLGYDSVSLVFNIGEEVGTGGRGMWIAETL